MKKPERYFEVQFTSPAFSVAEITAFAVDHEARLTTNNPEGVFDDLVAATATALDALTGSAGREQTAKAIQKSRTAAKNQQLAKIKETISRQSGLVSAAHGKSSAEYLEFFPRGLSEFHTAREAEIPGLLQRLIDAATNHLPDLVPVFADLLAGWDAASGEAANRRASTGASAQSRSESIEALRRQLTKNLLTIGLHHLGRPELASVFFNTSLLYNRQSGTEDELPELPPVTV